MALRVDYTSTTAEATTWQMMWIVSHSREKKRGSYEQDSWSGSHDRGILFPLSLLQNCGSRSPEVGSSGAGLALIFYPGVAQLKKPDQFTVRAALQHDP